MIISGAWYAFHTITEMECRHSAVAITTEGSELGGMVTSESWSLQDEIMVTKLRHHYLSAMV